jgi:hypothetical protein
MSQHPTVHLRTTLTATYGGIVQRFDVDGAQATSRAQAGVLVITRAPPPAFLSPFGKASCAAQSDGGSSGAA